MRKSIENGLRFRDAHLLEHAQRLRPRGRGILALVQANRLGDLLTYREYRV